MTLTLMKHREEEQVEVIRQGRSDHYAQLETRHQTFSSWLYRSFLPYLSMTSVTYRLR